MKDKYNTLIMRDNWDGDIFHIGYRFPMRHSGKFHQKTAMSIHIDDIEGIFGEELLMMANKINQGEWEFIVINVSEVDTNADSY